MDAQMIVDTVVSLDEDVAVAIINSIMDSRPELAPAVVTHAVPDLTYPPSKTLNERRSKGAVKSFNMEKGFGFIQCDELSTVFGSDVFVHGKQMGDFAPGTTVSFAVVLNKDNRPQAYDIQHDPPRGFGKGAGGGGGGDGFGMKGGGGKGISNDGWEKGGAGFNASAMMEMMGARWGDKVGSAGKSFGGCFGGGKGGGGGCGGTGAFKVNDSQVLGSFAGYIKSFNPKSGYGFIESPDLKAAGYDKDVFLSHQQLEEFEVGAQVQFTAFLNGKGQPQAKDLVDLQGGESAAKKPKTIGFGGGGAW